MNYFPCIFTFWWLGTHFGKPAVKGPMNCPAVEFFLQNEAKKYFSLITMNSKTFSCRTGTYQICFHHPLFHATKLRGRSAAWLHPLCLPIITCGKYREKKYNPITRLYSTWPHAHRERQLDSTLYCLTTCSHWSHFQKISKVLQPYPY